MADIDVEHARSRDPAATDHTLAGRTRVVLVLDDDDAARLSAAAHLRASGYDVAEARSLEEALLVLERGPVDIVLCDVTLPGNCGCRALMRWLSEHRPAVKRIVTADAESNLAAADGYGLFLSKPHRPADLDYCLERVLAGHG